MNHKVIVVVTSTRADYNYFRLILKKIIESSSLTLSLLVTGSHLLESHGKTIEIIKKDNIPIASVIEMYDENNSSRSALGKAVGKAVFNFAEVLNEIKPDLLLVLGDRYEALAAVIAASTLLIPIAHIHGGDNISYGQVDEQVRHSITKFAHIHFPATKKSAERIKLLGEEEWRIFSFGTPSIDHVHQETFLSKKQICRKYELDEKKDIVICIQHPYTIKPEKSGEQMRITLKVLNDLNLQCVIIYPNNDPGHVLIINEIHKHEENSNFKIFKNIEFLDYFSLLKQGSLLIGNSSSGLIESPTFKIPVVNVGNRNRGRESAENVIDVPHDYNAIRNAILKALSNEFKEICEKVKNPYGNGTASENIVKKLEDLEINKKLLIKKLTYNV